MVSQAAASRRTLLGSALAAGGALSISACASRDSAVRAGVGGRQARHDDVAVLEQLLELERWAVAAYTASIPLLAPPAVPAAKQFLRQELSHAGELFGLIRTLGAKPRAPKSNYDIGRPRSSEQMLRLLHQLESEQLTAYLKAIPTLAGGSVRATAATIAANDAQHLSVLRIALGQAPAPDAFVSGRE